MEGRDVFHGELARIKEEQQQDPLAGYEAVGAIATHAAAHT
jgi:hypothetical protein